ncbi:MAG: ABC transporter permease [Phycisphaerales bacterium]|nr:ABC transporter permease [Phycisphaerales bacterium]MCA9306594.1 ABC transporter permease [Phycisphaerales bacterium]
MWIARLGAMIVDTVSRFGEFTLFTLATLGAVVTGVPAWAKWSRFGTQLYLVGTRSVPVVGLTGAMIGAILAVEGYDQFAAFGQESRLGAVVNISITKQIGPVLAAVMLAGRVGCSLAAELGSMRVTDQIDAMRVMAADPLRVLVAPRVVACVVMIPILTVASILCGIFGGWFVTTKLYGVNPEAYWDFTRVFIDWFDVMNGVVKSVFFGTAIGVISCYKGFRCRSGAQGVGRATTEAFVASFVVIVIINLVLAKLLNDIDAMRLGTRM